MSQGFSSSHFKRPYLPIADKQSLVVHISTLSTISTASHSKDVGFEYLYVFLKFIEAYVREAPSKYAMIASFHIVPNSMFTTTWIFDATNQCC
jgi:hypothetical protein